MGGRVWKPCLLGGTTSNQFQAGTQEYQVIWADSVPELYCVSLTGDAVVVIDSSTKLTLGYRWAFHPQTPTPLPTTLPNLLTGFLNGNTVRAYNSESLGARSKHKCSAHLLPPQAEPWRCSQVILKHTPCQEPDDPLYTARSWINWPQASSSGPLLCKNDCAGYIKEDFRENDTQTEFAKSYSLRKEKNI